MTYEEKITFCKAHLGEEVQFADVDTELCYLDHVSRLGGIRSDGRFNNINSTPWKFFRLIPKPQFIDWTMETAESVQLRRKSDGVKVWVNYGPACAWYHGGGNTYHVPYLALLEEWETVDGRPCGTEVKDV